MKGGGPRDFSPGAAGPVLAAMEGVRPAHWSDRANCASTDPEIFFPEKGGTTRFAKKVCRSCDVRAECLEDALDRDERFGVRGGLSERERRSINRQRAAEQVAA